MNQMMISTLPKQPQQPQPPPPPQHLVLHQPPENREVTVSMDDILAVRIFLFMSSAKDVVDSICL